MSDILVVIGGAAGQGIQTVGDLVAETCRRSGFFVLAVNHFESRIRGGHSFVEIRVSDQHIHCPREACHLLVALDDVTVETHLPRLSPGALVLREKAGETGKTQGHHWVAVDFKALAEAAGGRITANTVAAGACLGLLGAPFEIFAAVVKAAFADGEALEKNLRAARSGFDAVKSEVFSHALDWKAGPEKGPLFSGAQAVALGAIAAGCRFAAFYPMSPATGVIRSLADLTRDYPFVVEQAEDEIAAVNMVIGASFAGVRSMTATSGGGFCLMTEGLGLAAMTETPIVIVNAQRPGPATGLPTRTAQGDLLFCVFASQDEFPRFVFAPRSAADAVRVTRRAFDLAEKYQVPAIILTDQYFNDSLFLMDAPLEAPEAVSRYTVSDADLENPPAYDRFARTQSGISPRALPCAGRAIVRVTGNEHREDGHISEDQENRGRMVDKRNAKLPAMREEMQGPDVYYGDAGLLLLGWGSAAGAILEAVDQLRETGVDAGCLTFSDLWPLPEDRVLSAVGEGKTCITVELNATAQFSLLLRQQTGLACAGSVLKYDGRPLTPEYIGRKLAPFL